MFSYLIQYPYTIFSLPSSRLNKYIHKMSLKNHILFHRSNCSWNQLQRLQTKENTAIVSAPQSRGNRLLLRIRVSAETLLMWCHRSHELLPLYRQIFIWKMLMLPITSRLKINNVCSVATLNRRRSYSYRAGVPRGHHSMLIIFAPVFTASWTDQDLNLFSDFCMFNTSCLILGFLAYYSVLLQLSTSPLSPLNLTCFFF